MNYLFINNTVTAELLPFPRSTLFSKRFWTLKAWKICGLAFISGSGCSLISHQLLWNTLTVLSSALKTKWSQLRPLFWPWIQTPNTRRYKRLHSAAVVNFEAKRLPVLYLTFEILDLSPPPAVVIIRILEFLVTFVWLKSRGRWFPLWSSTLWKIQSRFKFFAAAEWIRGAVSPLVYSLMWYQRNA